MTLQDTYPRRQKPTTHNRCTPPLRERSERTRPKARPHRPDTRRQQPTANTQRTPTQRTRHAIRRAHTPPPRRDSGHGTPPRRLHAACAIARTRGLPHHQPTIIMESARAAEVVAISWLYCLMCLLVVFAMIILYHPPSPPTPYRAPNDLPPINAGHTRHTEHDT